MEHVVLPLPPEGFEYTLIPIKGKRETVRDKDPKELSKNQLRQLEYREKNREKISEKRRIRYRKQKQINLSKEETSETTKSE